MGGASGSGGVELAKSSVTRREAEPNAERTASEDLASFSWAFAEEVRDPTRNFVFSPYSVVAASAMLSAGARGETLAGIQTGLHFGSMGEPLHQAQNALSQVLAQRNHDGQVLKVSNDFWMSRLLSPGPEFLDTLARHYGAGAFLAPFASAPEEARLAINEKLSQDTEALIPALLPPDSITADTTFVLTNAIYLRARWAELFDDTRTSSGVFNALDGAELSASMMRGVLSRGSYFVGDGFFALALPYGGNELEMVFLVPELGQFPSFLPTLDAERVNGVIAALQREYIDLTLPKFSVDYATDLKAGLSSAGMEQAFSDAADFGLVAEGVYVQSAFHRAVLRLDEEGTIAAAATAVGAAGAGSGAAPVPIPVVVDRPFVFFLRDRASGAILFLGHVVDPGPNP